MVRPAREVSELYRPCQLRSISVPAGSQAGAPVTLSTVPAPTPRCEQSGGFFALRARRTNGRGPLGFASSMRLVPSLVPCVFAPARPARARSRIIARKRTKHLKHGAARRRRPA